jgi:hypothetical protein
MRDSGFQLAHFADIGLDAAVLAGLIDRHTSLTLPRLGTLWNYYRNPMTRTTAATGSPGAGRAYRLAQERGLPARITGGASSDRRADDRLGSGWTRKEIVVENDIAWRIQTMVDFLFGRPVVLRSTARDPALRARIERAIEAAWEASGGISLLQDAALLGHVYGHVDFIVRAADLEPASAESDEAALLATARRIRVEVVEPRRGFAVLRPDDYREIQAYVLRWEREDRGPSSADAHAPGFRRFLPQRWWLPSAGDGSAPGFVEVVEVLSGSVRQVYESRGGATPVLVDEGPAFAGDGALDAPPVVHVQNLSQPFSYEGLGEVEPLIPLQDELNTRLSDRAYRVTMSAFRMYFAKGLDADAALAIGPGKVLSTDNTDATLTTVGGDASSPSEDSHVEQIREALDKQSGVPPLATGVVRAKVGNLTSENALRLTLTGLISKTERKRITYGRGLAQVSRLVLDALDRAGVLPTAPEDRGIKVEWPDVLPRSEDDLLAAAKQKLEIGVPRARVLAELGYAAGEPEIV